MARPKVLVVEDDTDIRELLQEALTLEGYDTVTAADGKAGIEKLRDEPGFSVILLDLMMPRMNGWQFLEEQKQIETVSKIPVVLLTAVGESSRKVPEVSAYVQKPLDLEELLDAVGKQAGKSS
jgi:CheY-like chemotaxis protein